MALQNLVKWVKWVLISSGNGLLPDRHLAIRRTNANLNCQMDPQDQISLKFESEY